MICGDAELVPVLECLLSPGLPSQLASSEDAPRLGQRRGWKNQRGVSAAWTMEQAKHGEVLQEIHAQRSCSTVVPAVKQPEWASQDLDEVGTKVNSEPGDTS